MCEVALALRLFCAIVIRLVVFQLERIKLSVHVGSPVRVLVTRGAKELEEQVLAHWTGDSRARERNAAVLFMRNG